MRMNRVRAKKASRTAAKPPRSPRCFPQIKLPGCFPDHPMPGRSCYPSGGDVLRRRTLKS